MANVNPDVIRAEADRWDERAQQLEHIRESVVEHQLAFDDGPFVDAYNELAQRFAVPCRDGRQSMLDIRDRLRAIAARYEANETSQAERFQKLYP
jgi:hypothetical protein